MNRNNKLVDDVNAYTSLKGTQKAKTTEALKK